MSRPLLALAFLAPLLSAASIGNVPVGDGEATLAVGDISVGPREGGASCPSYATTPDHWNDASQENFADLDPAEPPTQFGAAADPVATANTASSPAFRTLCPSGIGKPCFHFDGGDRWYDADSSLSAFNFLHDGSGATCLVVYEIPSMAAAMSVVNTNNGSTGNIGLDLNRNGVLNRDQVFIANGTGGQAPFSTDDTNNEDETHLLVFSHATARTPDSEVRFDENQDRSADYSFTPSGSNQTGRFTVGSRANSASALTGYVYEVACWESSMSTAELEAIEAVAECKWGGAFPL